MRCRSFTNVVIRVNYRKHHQIVTARAGTARVFHRGPRAAAILLPISDFRFKISNCRIRKLLPRSTSFNLQSAIRNLQSHGDRGATIQSGTRFAKIGSQRNHLHWLGVKPEMAQPNDNFLHTSVLHPRRNRGGYGHESFGVGVYPQFLRSGPKAAQTEIPQSGRRAACRSAWTRARPLDRRTA
jgi:hypothetical protein